MVQLFYVSDILVNPNQWDNNRECIKAKVLINNIERNKINYKVSETKRIILQAFENLKQSSEYITSENLTKYIDRLINPDNNKTFNLAEDNNFFQLFQKFIYSSKVSTNRLQSYKVVLGKLKRFELYYRLSIKNNFILSLNTFSVDILDLFEQYLFNEVSIMEKFPEIYKEVPKTQLPKPKGQNAVTCILTILRTFFNWSIKNNHTNNYPFAQFKLKQEVYGTPFYLTIEERNTLYNYDFSYSNELEIQRDIFIFQCVIGCRVSDLYSLTKNNIINGAIEYIALKKKNDPVTLRVPLNNIAKEIIDKYKDYKGEKLFPFISQPKYNFDIKKVLKQAGIDRVVTILNPLTRLQEQKPLYEVASTHTARKTFIGNLYKQVEDPNLISSLTGHSEGSKAFARYRDIDEEMKKELVDLLN
ncbi:MAG: putative bacteriophage integrase [Bacteroidetes bacterium]|nr:putative bacteriophage integrase [Bacteroidota bacterium]